MQPVFIVDDEHKKRFLERNLAAKVVVPTDGLLYDLPPSSRELGVDILDDFELSLADSPRNPRVISRLLNHRARPIVILTSPTEEGARIAQQVLQLFELPPDSAVHLALPALDLGMVSNYREYLRPVGARTTLQFEARRALDRMMGFMLTEYLQAYRQREPKVPFQAGMDRYSAHILCMLLQRGKQAAEVPHYVALRQPAGFTAYLTEPVPEATDLSTLHPVTHDKATAERLAQELRQGTPPVLQRNEQYFRSLPPTPPLFFPQVVTFALYQDLTFAAIAQQLGELYSTGLTTHFMPITPHAGSETIRSALRQHFSSYRVEPYYNPAATFHHRGCIRPVRLLPRGILEEHTKLTTPYTMIQAQAVNHARQRIPYAADHLLFQFGSHHLLGYQPKALPPDMLNANFELDRGSEYVPGSGYTLLTVPATGHGLIDRPRAVLAPDLEQFLSLFVGQYNTTQILSALHNLVVNLKYLQLTGDTLCFTPAGLACASVLQDRYGAFLSHQRLVIDEKALRAIGLGLEDKNFFLRCWYQHFRSRHEDVMATFRA